MNSPLHAYMQLNQEVTVLKPIAHYLVMDHNEPKLIHS
jgi:hypothetical protein